MCFYIEAVEERGREFCCDENIERQVYQVASILGTQSHRFFIIFMGHCGNGKTTMMIAIRKLIHYLFGTMNPGISHLKDFKTTIPIVSAKDLAVEIIQDKNYGRSYGVLMIDDLGSEPAEIIHYGMIYTPLVDLLEARYARMKFTIISTNLSREKIRPTYHNRLADRLNEVACIVNFTGESYRLI